jgi:O-antigen/teichoic acid export membrane protein
MASVAIKGTAWATGQLLVNKAVAVAAILLIAEFLSTTEFGVAALSLSVAKFLCVFPPLNMGDVLIARGGNEGEAMASARRIVLFVGGAVAMVGVAAGIPAAWIFHEYPRELLIPLIAVACLRPFGESMQVCAFTELRIQFRNREIALIDGSVQLAGTLASVLLAWIGFGAWALVGTSTTTAFGKALCYRWAVGSGPRVAYADRSMVKQVRNEFMTASSGQYLHSVVDSLPFLLLGWLSSANQTGLYAFAVSLSGQANTLVATQVSSVLQPVLGKLRHDAERQTHGYLRALSALSALAVPVCLTQAIFSGVIFEVFFDERWRDAAPVFAAMSIVESFFFAAAPTMAMLKAQGRFRTFLAWQGLHLAVSLPILAFAAMRGGAVSVAVCGAALWSVSLPLAVWMGIRHGGLGLLSAMRVFAAPWSTALPIGIAAWLLIAPTCSIGKIGNTIALVAIAPTAVCLMLWATRWSQPRVYREVSKMVSRASARLPFLRR